MAMSYTGKQWPFRNGVVPGWPEWLLSQPWYCSNDHTHLFCFFLQWDRLDFQSCFVAGSLWLASYESANHPHVLNNLEYSLLHFAQNAIPKKWILCAWRLEFWWEIVTANAWQLQQGYLQHWRQGEWESDESMQRSAQFSLRIGIEATLPVSYALGMG